MKQLGSWNFEQRVEITIITPRSDTFTVNINGILSSIVRQHYASNTTCWFLSTTIVMVAVNGISIISGTPPLQYSRVPGTTMVTSSNTFAAFTTSFATVTFICHTAAIATAVFHFDRHLRTTSTSDGPSGSPCFSFRLELVQHHSGNQQIATRKTVESFFLLTAFAIQWFYYSLHTDKGKSERGGIGEKKDREEREWKEPEQKCRKVVLYLYDYCHLVHSDIILPLVPSLPPVVLKSTSKFRFCRIQILSLTQSGNSIITTFFPDSLPHTQP